MSSGYERPDSGDGGTACAYTDHEAADDVEYGEKEWAASPGDGSPARGEGAA
jgi:hypothetical protein